MKVNELTKILKQLREIDFSALTDGEWMLILGFCGCVLSLLLLFILIPLFAKRRKKLLRRIEEGEEK